MQIISPTDFYNQYINFDFDKLLIDNDNQYINDNNYYLSYKNSYLISSKINHSTLESLISEMNSLSSFNSSINIDSNIILFNSNISNLLLFNKYKFIYKQLIISQRLLFDNFIEYIKNLNILSNNQLYIPSPASSIKSKKSFISKFTSKLKK